MIHEFNLAILGKQSWRLVQFLDSLLARVLRRKYFICSSLLPLNKAYNPSYGWTSTMVAKPLISLQIRQKLHFENEIMIWEDLWLPTLPARPARHIATVVHLMMPVSELLIGSPKRWNTEILENYVSPEDISLMQSLAMISSRSILPKL